MSDTTYTVPMILTLNEYQTLANAVQLMIAKARREDDISFWEGMADKLETAWEASTMVEDD